MAEPWPGGFPENIAAARPARRAGAIVPVRGFRIGHLVRA